MEYKQEAKRIGTLNLCLGDGRHGAMVHDERKRLGILAVSTLHPELPAVAAIALGEAGGIQRLRESTTAMNLPA